MYRSFLAAPENETDEHQAEQLHQSDISSESESEEEELEGEAKIEKFTGTVVIKKCHIEHQKKTTNVSLSKN